MKISFTFWSSAGTTMHLIQAAKEKSFSEMVLMFQKNTLSLQPIKGRKWQQVAKKLYKLSSITFSVINWYK